MRGFPSGTRNAYLSGDVTPLVRVTLRQTRLDFGSGLYHENDEGIIGSGTAGDDGFDLPGYQVIWGDSAISPVSPYARVRVVGAAAWTALGSSSVYGARATQSSDDWTLSSISSSPTIGQFCRLGVYAQTGSEAYYVWYVDTSGDLRRVSLSSGFSWGSPTAALNLPGYSGIAVHPVSATEAIVVGYNDPVLWVRYCVYSGSWNTSESEWYVRSSDELVWSDAHWSDAEVSPADSNTIVCAVNLNKWGSAHTILYNKNSGIWSQPYEILPSNQDFGDLKVRVSGMSTINSRLWAVTTREPVGSNGALMAHHVALASSPDGINWRDEDFVTVSTLRGKLLSGGAQTYCHVVGGAGVARSLSTNKLGYDSASLKYTATEIRGVSATHSGPGSAPEITVQAVNADGDGSDLLGMVSAGNEMTVELGASGQDYDTYCTGVVLANMRTEQADNDEVILNGAGKSVWALGGVAYKPAAAKVYDTPYSLHSKFQFQNGNARLTVRQVEGTWVCDRHADIGRYALHCKKPPGLALVPQSFRSQHQMARVAFSPRVSVEGIYFVFWYEDEDNYWRAGVYNDAGTHTMVVDRIVDGLLDGGDHKADAACVANLSLQSWYSMYLDLRPDRVRVYLRRADDYKFFTSADSTSYDVTLETDAIPDSFHIGLAVDDFEDYEGALFSGTVTKAGLRYMQDSAESWSDVVGKWLLCNEQERLIVDYTAGEHEVDIEPPWANIPSVGDGYGIYSEEIKDGPRCYFKEFFSHEGMIPWTVDDITTNVLEMSGVTRDEVYGSTSVPAFGSSSPVMTEVDLKQSVSGSATYYLWCSGTNTGTHSGFKVTVQASQTDLYTITAGASTLVAEHPNMVALSGTRELRIQANKEHITVSADGHFLTSFPATDYWTGGYVGASSGTSTTTEFPENQGSYIWDGNEAAGSALQRILRYRRAKLVERSDGTVAVSRFETALGDAGTYTTPLLRRVSGESLGQLVSFVEMIGAEERGYYIDSTAARRRLAFERANNYVLETQDATRAEAKRTIRDSYQLFEQGQVSLYIADPDLEPEDEFTVDGDTYVVQSSSFVLQKDEGGKLSALAEFSARKTAAAAATGVYGTAAYDDGTEYG